MIKKNTIHEGETVWTHLHVHLENFNLEFLESLQDLEFANLVRKYWRGSVSHHGSSININWEVSAVNGESVVNDLEKFLRISETGCTQQLQSLWLTL